MCVFFPVGVCRSLVYSAERCIELSLIMIERRFRRSCRLCDSCRATAGAASMYCDDGGSLTRSSNYIAASLNILDTESRYSTDSCTNPPWIKHL